MTQFIITPKNAESANALKKVLSQFSDIEIEEASDGFRDNFMVGDFKENEKLSSIAGIWKGNRLRDANKIRQEAWTRKK